MNKTDAHTPVIVPRSEHPVSRKDFSHNVLVVLRELDRHRYKGYLVGGAIRDLLLGRKPKDMDVATDATPNQVKKLFRSCRIIGRRFRLAHIHFRDEIVEVATFRRSESDPDLREDVAVEEPAPGGEALREPSPRFRHEGLLKADDGRILKDNIFGTPEQDARRRDFTINALFYDIGDFSLIDYVGGLEDIRRRVVRTIGDPLVRFTEDPVRMIRAVRFSAMLGFTIDPVALEAMSTLRDHLATASSSRMFEEILKLFSLGAAERTFQMLCETGLAPILFPFLEEGGERAADLTVERILLGLRWLDGLVNRGETVSTALVLAFLLLPAVEAELERLRAEGALSPQTIGEALREITDKLAQRVQIPGKLVADIRTLVWNQGRFRKTRGKYPRNFASSPEFPLALEYFRFNAAAGKADGALLSWWEQYLRLNPGEVPLPYDETPAAHPPRPRRRRRRRRGRGRGESGALPSPAGEGRGEAVSLA